jgi:hypothetical protein
MKIKTHFLESNVMSKILVIGQNIETNKFVVVRLFKMSHTFKVWDWYVYSVEKIVIIFPAIFIEQEIFWLCLSYFIVSGKIGSTPLIPRQRGTVRISRLLKYLSI